MEENFIGNLLKKPIWVAFLISWLFYLVGLFLFSHMVWDANTYQYNFKGTDFETALSNWRRIDMLLYLMSPVWVMGISAIVWIIIKLGLVITHIEFNTSLLFKIIFLGSIILFLPNWVKSVGLILFKSGYTPDDIKVFFPGSIVPFLDVSMMSEPQINALANVNLYHLGFILFSAWAIAKNSVLSYFKSFMLVLLTYGTCIALINFIRVLFFS